MPHQISWPKISVIAIILVLLAGNVYFGIQYFLAAKEFRQAQADLRIQKLNGKVLGFTKLFIDDVLRAQSDVDFETRLKLENAVRDLGDPAILSEWQKFTESTTEAQAQREVKNLLGLLIDKIEFIEIR